MALILVTLGGCFAGAAVLMMLACVPVGAVLRMLCASVVCEPSFDRVRDHGVWAVVRPCLASAARGAACGPWKWRPAWPREARDLAGKLAVVMGTSFASAAVVPFLTGAVLLGQTQQRSFLGDTLERASWLAGAVAMLLGAYLWVSGLGFVARPSVTRKFGPEPVAFPPGLTVGARDRLALNIYWRSCLTPAGGFSVIYPACFLLVLAQEQSLSIIVAVLIFLFFMAVPLAGLVWLASRFIDRRLLAEKICEELCSILKPPPQPATAPGGTGQGGAPSGKPDLDGLIGDPLGGLRGRVAQVAADLDDAAALLDNKQKRGLPPHPVATLMRAVARSLRQYLGSQKSLQDALDDDIKDLLATTLLLFGERGDPTVYTRLAQQARAFSPDGDPAVETARKPPGRLARLAGQVFEGIPKMSLTITSIAAMAAIIVAVVLALLHVLPISQLIQDLK